jgi:hypothetical protein
MEGMTEEKPEILDGSSFVITSNQYTFSQDTPKAILEFRSNGEILHYGKLVESDKDKIEVLRGFILSRRWYT